MTAPRFRDIVAWDALVAPGVVVCKDAALLCAWEVRGIDTGRASLEEQQALRVEIARALGTLEGGEMLWTLWQRRPWQPRPLLAPTGDAVLDALADETNGIFAGPGRVWSDSFTLWFRAPGHIGASARLEAALAAFERRRRHIEGWLEPILGLERIDGPASGMAEDNNPLPALGPPAEILCRLADLAGTPRSAPRLAGLPIALDALIAPDLSQPVTSGPVISSGVPLAVMSLSGEREQYAPAPLEPLQNLALPFIWITRYGAYSQGEARETLGWLRKLRRQSAADLLANIEGSSTGERNLHEDRLLTESDLTRETIERGEEGYGRWCATLILRGEGVRGEGLGARVQALREAIQPTGFVLRHESAGAVATWLAALPGHAHALPREVMVPARVAADCMPVRGLGRAHRPSALLPPETPPLLPAVTFAGTLHPFNLHVGDVGHTLVFGPTGTGKSVLLGNLVAAWLRYPQARVIAFDRGRSLRYATAALGGVWLEPGAGDSPGEDANGQTDQTGEAADIDGVRRPVDRNAGSDRVAPLSQITRLGMEWGLTWVTELLTRGMGRRLSPDETREVGLALAHLACSDRPSLTRLAEMVQNKDIRAALQPWTTGQRAHVFDAPEACDVPGTLARERLTVFETGPLIEGAEDVTVLALDYIFAEIEAGFGTRPTLIVIDEAWKLLEHDIFAARLRSWLREGRKKNVALLMATQSVSDAARASVTADLVESCPTRVYLANPMATTSGQAPHYAALGLRADETAVISVLRRKAQMLLVQDGCARVLSLPMGPVHLSILGRTSMKESDAVAMRERAGRLHPAFWKADLAANTQSDAAAALDEGPPRTDAPAVPAGTVDASERGDTTAGLQPGQVAAQ